MKNILCVLAISISSLWMNTNAQTKNEDGTWEDNNLAFKVLYEDLDSTGELMICVMHTESEKCIENLTTGFQIDIYNSNGKEIWNSLWTGKNLDIKFKKPFPDAAWVIIKANKNYVVNKTTGTRIYQDEPIVLKHMLK